MDDTTRILRCGDNFTYLCSCGRREAFAVDPTDARVVLGALGAGDERIRALTDDTAEVALYDFRTGTMARTTVGRMARGGPDPDVS